MPSKLSTDEILRIVGDSPAGKVKLAITDIDGVLRGKVVHLDKFQSAIESGFGFCDVVFGWDCADESYDNSTFTGWHTGYPDAPARIDLSTFRRIPWDSDLPFFLADFEDQDGKPSAICPRQVLKKVRAQAESMGFEAVFAQEFEWFNFLESSADLHQRGFHSPRPLTPGMFGYSMLRSSQHADYFNELFDLLGAFDIPIEGLHTETGPGVYEAAILYAEVLDAADRAVLFKASTKEIAARHGIIPSFMAKWSDQLPGCSGHVHQSLWADGKNVFHDENVPRGLSNTMKSYMAGVLHCLPHILPLYAPTINSYKRLVEGAWAPTTLTWGIDNRTTALRALPGSPKSARLEMRVPGSDVNPYLAMAGCLASGLYGIREGLELDTPMTQGNGYRDLGNGILPRNLDEATQVMKASKVARDLFSETFLEHFVQSREWEWRQYSAAVTDWELKRYLEII